MHVTADQIQKINHFSSLSRAQCGKIAAIVEQSDGQPGIEMLKEGDFGDTMLLVFQGQVEVSKNFLVRTSSGFAPSRKAIVRLETTDPPPATDPISEPSVFVVKLPAFGIGEFSLVLDQAIRTANVIATTPIKYCVLRLDDFSKLVEEDSSIGGAVYFEVAKAAVSNLAVASADISNLTQAFFFALSR